MSFWEILGIEPTQDHSSIKKAYAKKLKVYHPEDDPEGFQRLREAYDNAVRYAKNPPEQPTFFIDDEEIEEDEIAGTESLPKVDLFHHHEDIERVDPLKDFMEQLYSIYHDFSSRIDIEKWQELLSSEIVWDFKYNEKLTNRVLEFLMEFHYLPQNVWQLLDNIFGWRGKADELEYRFPENFITYIFRQVNHRWGLRYQFLKEQELDYDTYLGTRERALFALIDNDIENAEKLITEAYEMFSCDPDLLRMKAEYYLRVGRLEASLEAINSAIQADPTDIDSHLYKARVLFKLREQEDVIKTCEFILEYSFDNQDAITLMGKSYFELGEKEKAKKLFIQVLENDPYNIEVKTYIAQINGLLVQNLKQSPNKQNLITVQNELGKIDTFEEFWDLWFRRSWKYLVTFAGLILFLMIGLESATGLPPKDALKEVALSLISKDLELKEPIIINKLEDFERVQSEDDVVDLYHLKAEFIDMIEDDTDIPGISYLEYDQRYICVATIEDQTLIVLVDYETAQKVYQNKSLKLEGSIYEFNEELFNYTIRSLKKYRMYYEYDNTFIKDKYIGPKRETESGDMSFILFLSIIIITLFAFIMLEARRVYRAVKF
ncbi:J domain-containing protein [Bacillus suaedaesalsae]|uniref:DnaJ domain-containing protein n=1 Tax=Bacillus suaedaesalsae TaxID=2810349 RepID=A0ABS2DDS8_9BACI|nr:J domain-containing protein [Bacillus suaedaesalsae]MBM6616604.1 DnaJ domain-containing protein [Bacillus suaedaesalsae]